MLAFVQYVVIAGNANKLSIIGAMVVQGVHSTRSNCEKLCRTGINTWACAKVSLSLALSSEIADAV